MNIKPTVCATCRLEYDANRHRSECPHEKRIFSDGIEFVSNGWNGGEGLTRHTGGSSLGHVSGLAIGKME